MGTGEEVFGQSNFSEGSPADDIEEVVIVEGILLALESFDDALLFADFLCDLELMEFGEVVIFHGVDDLPPVFGVSNFVFDYFRVSIFLIRTLTFNVLFRQLHPVNCLLRKSYISIHKPIIISYLIFKSQSIIN